MNTDDSARLSEAADYLDHLHESSKHIPADPIPHDFNAQPVAQFFYDGAAEVFLALTLGPASLPLLAQWLRDEHKWNRAFEGASSRAAALALADHILKAKESSV
jgi:hypothetical protein